MKENFAFIDSQNLYLALKDQALELDYRKFRQYLKDKYRVTQAIMYFGYIKSREPMYAYFRRCGYELIFKKTAMQGGKWKGNIDVKLTIDVIDRMHEYNQAIIVTNDGDFADLVEHLIGERKFLRVIAPTQNNCSHLLKAAAKGSIQYIDTHHKKLLEK